MLRRRTLLVDNIDTDFDAGGKESVCLTATTIVSQWVWAATLIQSSAVGRKFRASFSFNARPPTD